MSAETVSSGLLQTLTERSRSLYSLPAVASRVLELTRQPDLDTRELRDCIQTDPALTVKILRVVNSSLFGLSREVSDLNHAIAHLGTKSLKMLVLSFSVPRELFHGADTTMLQNYWRRSLVRAVVAREISGRFQGDGGDEGFVAGLLQGIGMLVLLQYVGEPYRELLDELPTGGPALLEKETAKFGFNHTELTRRLLNDWGLPPSIVDKSEQPYDVNRVLAIPTYDRALSQVLHLTELLTSVMLDNDPKSLHELLETSKLYGASLSIEQMRDLVSILDEKVQALASILDVHIVSRERFADVLADAMLQMDMLIEEAATVTACSASSDEEETPSPDDGATVAPARKVSHSEFAQRVASLVTTSVQAEMPMSLALLEVDDFETIASLHSEEKTKSIVRSLSNTVYRLMGKMGMVLQVGDRRWAFGIVGSERQETVALIRWFHDEVRNWLRLRETITQHSVSISIGLASITSQSRGLASSELVDAAESCLGGAKLQGGNVMKSIELY